MDMDAKKIFAVLAAAALVGVLTGTQALAAGPEKERTGSYERGSYQEQQTGTSQPGRMGEQAMVNRAGDMIGRTVKDGKGEQLGTVKDFVVDPRGQVQYLIVSQGGIMGIGDRLTPIPFRAAEVDMREEVVVLEKVDKQKLSQAPTFSEQEWRMLGEPEFEREVYTYYGEEQPTESGTTRRWQPERQIREQRLIEQLEKEESRIYEREGYQEQQLSASPHRRGEQAMVVNRAGDMLGRTVKDDQGQRLGTVKDFVIGESGEVQYLILDSSVKPKVSTAKEARLPNWAGQVLGCTVKDDKGRVLGTVDDVAVDRSGRVQNLVLSTGTTISQELIPIPYRAAKMNLQEEAVVLENVDKGKLDQAPYFTGQQWRKLEEPEFERRVYSYYGQEQEGQMQQQRLQRQPQQEERRTYERGTSTREQTAAREPGRYGEAAVNRAGEMFARTVETDRGEKLGTVKDFVIDREGEVQYLILSPDRSLAMDDKLIPIPYKAAAMDMREEAVVLKNMDKQKLQQAPNFSEQEWRRLTEPEFERRVYSYYGQEQPGESGTMQRWQQEEQRREQRGQEQR